MTFLPLCSCHKKLLWRANIFCHFFNHHHIITRQLSIINVRLWTRGERGKRDTTNALKMVAEQRNIHCIAEWCCTFHREWIKWSMSLIYCFPMTLEFFFVCVFNSFRLSKSIDQTVNGLLMLFGLCSTCSALHFFSWLLLKLKLFGKPTFRRDRKWASWDGEKLSFVQLLCIELVVHPWSKNRRVWG
jgi:hypothetical protein